MLRRLKGPLFAFAVLIVAAACGGGDAGDPASGEVSALRGSLTVFAAASLTESFSALAESFEDEFPEVSVTTNFAASSELATQIMEGAPADVYASADDVNMQRVVDADETDGEPRVFATNRLQIIVESGNPLGIATLDDLSNPALLYITAAPEAPIGRYTAEVLEAAGVDVTPRSLEENVRGIVNKVVLGEADAGIVYATDVRAAGDSATGIEIPDEFNVVARYPIVVTAATANPIAARAFVDFVTSDTGRSILSDFGFGTP
jgi:molybdate transport system substrate-binding protein